MASKTWISTIPQIYRWRQVEPWISFIYLESHSNHIMCSVTVPTHKFLSRFRLAVWGLYIRFVVGFLHRLDSYTQFICWSYFHESEIGSNDKSVCMHCQLKPRQYCNTRTPAPVLWNVVWYKIWFHMFLYNWVKMSKSVTRRVQPGGNPLTLLLTCWCSVTAHDASINPGFTFFKL